MLVKRCVAHGWSDAALKELRSTSTSTAWMVMERSFRSRSPMAVRFANGQVRVSIFPRSIGVAKGGRETCLNSCDRWIESIRSKRAVCNLKHDGECPVELHWTRNARQLAPGERKLGCFTNSCRHCFELCGECCRNYMSWVRVPSAPLRPRGHLGAVAQQVEQYRFTILVATILENSEQEQEPNARRDYICQMSRLGKTLVGSFA